MKAKGNAVCIECLANSDKPADDSPLVLRLKQDPLNMHISVIVNSVCAIVTDVCEQSQRSLERKKAQH